MCFMYAPVWLGSFLSPSDLWSVLLLTGKGGDNIGVLLLVETFDLCAYDNVEPASVVFYPRFYGPSSGHFYIWYASLLLFISIRVV